MTLSLCMIVKNEEDVLGRCLNSCATLFDEIIIVDTGSTDNTINIAKKYTNKVYNFEWVDDFAKARNYSFSKNTCDYIMWLDADDVIPEPELEKLKLLKQVLNEKIDVVMLKYAISFDENNQPVFTYYRERILKASANPTWEDPVHEAITPWGNIVYYDIRIEHRKPSTHTSSGRNLKIYDNLVKSKIQLKPRQLFYYARELYFNNKYRKAINIFKKFLSTTNGYKENYIEACLNLSKCYQCLNQKENALKSLFSSFYYDTPRAEILCEIGNLYLIDNNYYSAIYYYTLATQCEKHTKSGGFVLEECYDFLPYLQLCVCYYYSGNYEKSKEFHLKAKHLKPNNPIVINNDKIFNS